MSVLRDRARGVLLGQCIGDSLGAQVEFASAKSIKAAFPKGVRELIGGGPHRILPGQITDDSELALSLARSIAAKGYYTDEAAAQGYVFWLDSHPFDVGGTTSRALSLVDRSRPVAPQIRNNAQKVLSSQANGSLMRISPLAIYGAEGGVDYGAACNLAALDSQLTHANEVCQQACLGFVAMVRSLVTANDRTPGEFGYQDRATKVLWAYHNAYNRVSNPEVRRAMTAGRIEKLPEVDGGHQGWVLYALQIAVHQLFYARSFEEGLVSTVALGGDADTNGAIAGAALGALFGAAAIPERWKTVLLNCKTTRPKYYWCDDLLELADVLVSCGNCAAVA